MKRKAILIANTDGLPGTKKDIESIREFLLSRRGGHWYEQEITSLVNPSKQSLQTAISAAREAKYDFVLMHFSGHGGQKINDVILEINDKSEYILDSQLFGIATRQVSIFDCCRAIVTPSLEARKEAVFAESYSNSRNAYERLIMSAAEQQLKLYACSKGETAGEDSKGGYYTQNLLNSASSARNDPMTFNYAHTICSSVVRVITNDKQNPEIISGRHLSSQNLIISLP